MGVLNHLNMRSELNNNNTAMSGKWQNSAGKCVCLWTGRIHTLRLKLFKTSVCGFMWYASFLSFGVLQKKALDYTRFLAIRRLAWGKASKFSLQVMRRYLKASHMCAIVEFHEANLTYHTTVELNYCMLSVLERRKP